jgi:hypothetical protein
MGRAIDPGDKSIIQRGLDFCQSAQTPVATNTSSWTIPSSRSRRGMGRRKCTTGTWFWPLSSILAAWLRDSTPFGCDNLDRTGGRTEFPSTDRPTPLKVATMRHRGLQLPGRWRLAEYEHLAQAADKKTAVLAIELARALVVHLSCVRASGWS